jgi:hypothetical protein
MGFLIVLQGNTEYSDILGCDDASLGEFRRTVVPSYSGSRNLYIPCGYTGCPRRNVPDFGRVFLMLKYTDITQNTYDQSWTVTEIMAREKCGLLAGPRTVPFSWQSYHCPSLSVVSYYGNSPHASHKLHMYLLQADNFTSVLAIHGHAWNPKDNYDMSASVFVV